MKKIGILSGDANGRPKQTLDQLLYVEDDDSNWHVAELRLRAGYDVTRAANALQACRVLSLRGKQLAAILLDIELKNSDLNGIDLAELIRGKLPPERMPEYATRIVPLETPIIFLTAHGADYPSTRLRNVGAHSVLSKPIDFSALSLALTQLHLNRLDRQRSL
jgi:CheY-like chemotaxis protein